MVFDPTDRKHDKGSLPAKMRKPAKHSKTDAAHHALKAKEQLIHKAQGR
jgi:hypothetical protein